MTDFYTTTARAGITLLQDLAATGTLDEAGETKAMELHVATDLTLDEARWVLAATRHMGALVAVSLAPAFSELRASLQAVHDRAQAQQ